MFSDCSFKSDYQEVCPRRGSEPAAAPAPPRSGGGGARSPPFPPSHGRLTSARGGETLFDAGEGGGRKVVREFGFPRRDTPRLLTRDVLVRGPVESAKSGTSSLFQRPAAISPPSAPPSSGAPRSDRAGTTRRHAKGPQLTSLDAQ